MSSATRLHAAMQGTTHTSQHETPVKTFDVVGIGDVEECKVHDIADHDAERSPHLPTLEVSTSNEDM